MLIYEIESAWRHFRVNSYGYLHIILHMYLMSINFKSQINCEMKRYLHYQYHYGIENIATEGEQVVKSQ